MMRSYDALPAVPLHPAGPVTAAFRRSGLSDLREAGRYLMDLPYGRISKRSDLTLVLSEGRGTCSGKHALITLLAQEQAVALELLLAIFHMSEENTPGVGAVLEAHKLRYIPEAHCYLRLAETRIDITAPPKETETRRTFVIEEVITPAQVDEYKPAFHREYLQQWLAGPDGPPGLALADVW